MSFTKAVENRFKRLKKQRTDGRITEDEFLREVEKLQFEDEQGRLWMIDAYSGNWYFEENGQWVSDTPPKFEPEILCSNCGKPVGDPSDSLCEACQAEAATGLSHARSGRAQARKTAEQTAQQPPEPKATDEPASDERGWVPESSEDQRAQFFYDRGVENFDAGNWQQAIDFFEQALQIAPAYRDVRKLASVARERLEEAKDQRMLDSKLVLLYERAESKMSAGEWQDAYDLLQEVLSLDPDYREARALSEQALSELIVVEERRRQTTALDALYRQGELDFQAGQWAKAVELLSQVKGLEAGLFTDDPRYSKALDILSEAEKQQRLEVLYTDAAHNMQSKRWEQAARQLSEVVAIQKDYLDALSLLEVSERQSFIEKQRTRGAEHLAAGRWTEAADALGSVLKLLPDERAVQAGWLYARGRDHMRAEEWDESIQLFSELMALDASYRDVAAQLAKCKTTLRLESSYDAGVRHLQNGNRREALRAFDLVASIDAGYRDVGERIIATRTEMELADLYDQGDRYADGYRLPEAIATFEQVVARRDDYRDAVERLAEMKRLKRLADLYAQGLSAFQMGKWSEAIIDLKRAVEIDANYRDAAQRLQEAQRQDRFQDLYKRGIECAEDKDWSRAIEYFEQIVTEDETYRDAMARLMDARRQRQITGLYREGETRFAEGDWQEAMSAFEKMLSLDPNDEWGVMARLRESRRQRDLAQMYAQAVQLYEEHRWEEASELFHRLMDEEPNYQDTTLRLREIDKREELGSLHAKAESYRAAGQWDAAIEMYQRILNIDKEYESVAAELEDARLRRKIVSMYQEGQTLMDQQRWARALEVFERLLALAPGKEDVLARLAEAKKQQQLTELYTEAVRNLDRGAGGEAVACLEKVIAIDAGYRDAQAKLDQAREWQRFAQFLDRGRVLYEQENFDGAIGVLRRTLEIDPHHAEAQELLKNAQRKLETFHYYEAGLRYFENQQWDEAIDFLSRVVSRAPDFRDASSRLEAARTQKTLTELYQAAQKALRASDWQEAARILGQIVDVDGHYRDAADQLANAREQVRARLTGMYNKGKEHLSAGRWQAAINVFEQLQSEESGFADVEKLLREARLLQEQTELAALYEQGMRCMVAADWALAADYFERVQARAPDYKDIVEQLRVARQRQLRAYVSEAEAVAPAGSPYSRQLQVQGEAELPLVVPQPQRRGMPLMTIAFGGLGLLLCCMALSAVVLVARQSPEVQSRLALLFTPTPVSLTAGQVVSSGAAEAAAGVPGTTPVNPLPAGAVTPITLITSTIGMGEPSTDLVQQEMIPTVALDVPTLPTWTPSPSPTPHPTMEIAMNVDGGREKTLIKVPPAVQQAMQGMLAQTTSGTATAGEAAAAGQSGEAGAAEATPLPTATPEPTEVVVAPLSGKIAFSVYDPGPRRYLVYVANVDGSGMSSLLTDAGAPALSVDGNLLAYRSWVGSDRRIMVLDLTTGQYSRVTGFAEDSRPDWSQDGVLVFDSTRESDRESRIYSQGYWVGSTDLSLKDDTGRGLRGDNPSWLGPGRIAYDSCVDGCGIFVANADGSGASKIIDTSDRVSLDGSPDGTRIVYAAREDGNWDIYIIGADGSGDQQLTDDDAADWLPTWSPDGNTIAFVSNRDGSWAIWAVNPDGSNLRKLFDIPGSPDGLVRDEPAWSSQGWIEERISWAP